MDTVGSPVTRSTVTYSWNANCVVGELIVVGEVGSVASLHPQWLHHVTMLTNIHVT